jgi:hypothetical protein
MMRAAKTLAMLISLAIMIPLAALTVAHQLSLGSGEAKLWPAYLEMLSNFLMIRAAGGLSRGLLAV